MTIPSHWQSAKEAFDYTVPDNLAYLNPRFRPRILETVTHQMNMIVTKLALEEPRFKGKVSVCAHSLGTVISYDLLQRQHWENFGNSTAEDTALEAIEKIRTGDILKSRYYRRNSGEQELNTDHLAMNFLRPSFPEGSFNMHAQQQAGNNGNPIDSEYLQLIFPVKNLFLLGSPLGMFAAVYFEEPYIRSKLPTVDDFYNLFHPSDLVAFRLEPLIMRYEYPDHRQKNRMVGAGSFFELA